MQMKDSGTARVFFALWPETSVKEQLYTLAKKYQPQCNARLMQADTLHMTLQFIGEIAHARLPQLLQATDSVFAPSFDFKLEKISCWAHNKIAYAAPISEIAALNHLVKALQQVLVTAHIPFIGTQFTPHVTLLRHVEHAIAPQHIAPIMWRVNTFVLVESVTGKKGVHYRILQKWPLQH